MRNQVYQFPLMKPTHSAGATLSVPALFPSPQPDCVECFGYGEIEVFCPDNGKDFIPCEACGPALDPPDDVIEVVKAVHYG